MSKEWWQNISASDHLKVAGDQISEAETVKEIGFIEQYLCLAKGRKILDIACGNGRHSLELARRGGQVLGVDYCQGLLQIGLETAQKEGLPVEFLRADMREIPTRTKFDLVISMWHSLGYFIDENQNQKSIQEIGRLTEKDGHCFIHLNNPFPKIAEIITKGFPDDTLGAVLRKTENREPANTIYKESWFDPVEFRSHSRRRWINPETKSENIIDHDFRYFTYPEVRNLLQSLGFGEIKNWGDFDGEKYTSASPWLLVGAKKVI